MCYYNGQKVTHAEFIRLKQLEKAVARYDFLNRDVEVGFDFGQAAVLKPIEGKEDFDIVPMEWGFIPDPELWPFVETREQLNRIRKGYTDERGRYHDGLNFLNAKSEELLLKNKIYRKSALSRRCLVLSSGFYEWRHIYKINKRTGQPVKTPAKYPYQIGIKDREYFYLAGIWNGWEDADTGEYVESCAVITTQANLVMEQIHNSKKRMPTMLTDDLAYDWLFKPMDEKEITELAKWQMPWEELSYYTLSKDFLSSFDPLKPHHYPDLPPLDLPGGDLNYQQEPQQMGLF